MKTNYDKLLTETEGPTFEGSDERDIGENPLEELMIRKARLLKAMDKVQKSVTFLYKLRLFYNKRYSKFT